jgi:hypothetical protein
MLGLYADDYNNYRISILRFLYLFLLSLLYYYYYYYYYENQSLAYVSNHEIANIDFTS